MHVKCTAKKQQKLLNINIKCDKYMIIESCRNMFTNLSGYQRRNSDFWNLQKEVINSVDLGERMIMTSVRTSTDADFASLAISGPIEICKQTQISQRWNSSISGQIKIPILWILDSFESIVRVGIICAQSTNGVPAYADEHEIEREPVVVDATSQRRHKVALECDQRMLC